MNSYVQVFMLVLLTTSGADTAVLVTLAVITTPALSIGWACTRHSGGGRERGREGRSREQPESHIHMVQSVSHIPLPKWSHNCHTVTHILGMCRCSSSHHSQQDTCTVQAHSSSSLKQEDKAGHVKICTLLIVATNNKAT